MGNETQVVSLFSGAGGMSLGFAQAGLKPAFAADIDADACETYKANLGVDAFKTDLSHADEEMIKRVEQYHLPFALIGGPPCQGFSSAGKKDGKDIRNRLIFRYLSIVERLSPRWFLFENVEGLLTSNGGRSVCDLIREFVALGYCVRLEKVNFASYGLPQGRKRVIIVGNRIGVRFSLPAETHSFNAGKHKRVNGLPPAPSLDNGLAGLGHTVMDWHSESLYATSEPVNSYDRAMRDGNERRGVSLHVETAPPQLAEMLEKLLPGHTMKDLPPEYWHDSFKRRAFRRVMDGTPTEKRGGAPSGVKRLIGTLNALTITSAATREFIHPHENRPLTPRECARLQSFSDNFSFAGKPMSVIRQIGNAFPPLAAKAFAQYLLQVDGAFGADVSASRPSEAAGLIAYHLTDAEGMSPALARTSALLDRIAGRQRLLIEVA